MKIEAMAAAVPSRTVTNADITEMIGSESRGHFQGDLEGALRRIGGILRHSGSRTRRWHDSTKEKPVELTVQAARDALSQLNGTKPDLIIYASVFGVLHEPSNASFYAHLLGLDDVECLDIKQACDGWMRAAKMANAFINSGEHRFVLVINSEFSLQEGYAIAPQLFRLSTPEQLQHRFPAYTIGEAATATIFGPGGESWHFTSQSRNELYALCTVPNAWYRGEADPERVAMDGPGSFTSWGAELTENGIPLVVDTFRESGIQPHETNWLFTHSSSKRDWTNIAGQIGMGNKIEDIYASIGNVVSAAVPTAMALAVQDDRLQRGSRVAALVGSAGMCASTTSFAY